MKVPFGDIWKSTVPLLEKGRRKDFVLHTKGVIKAMEMLLEKEGGDEEILIPAAILHDVGWSKVPAKLQKGSDGAEQLEALRLHIKHAAPLVRAILVNAGFEEGKISKIIKIIEAHKFHNPKEHDKQMLIDADAMSDAFREQFKSDMKSYGKTANELYLFRKDSNFYTKTAKSVFNRELEARRKEFRS